MTIVLGHEGINRLLKEIKMHRRLLKEVVDIISEAIAQKGYELLSANAPLNDIDGNIPGTVDIEQRNDGWAVTYMGQDVAYIEFGTGYKGEGSPYPDRMALAKVDWAYDVNNHGAGGWFYYSKRDGTLRFSRGMTPEKPVLDTVNELRGLVQSIGERILNEKFGK